MSYHDDDYDESMHTPEEIAAYRASQELDRQKRLVPQVAAAIVTAANYFHDEATLIEAVSMHTRQLRGRDQFERLVDHLAIVIQMLADGSPAAMIDKLADAIRLPGEPGE